VTPRPVDFTVATYKRTPHFADWKYDYRSCHPQIGPSVTPGKSIVLIKTTIGRCNVAERYLVPTAFVVGYFRVLARDERWLYMDRDDSLLLLDNPIRLDHHWATMLLRGKKEAYWEGANNLTAKIGSSTRNRHAKPDELEFALVELLSRKRKGFESYLGPPYARLIRKRDGSRLDEWGDQS